MRTEEILEAAAVQLPGRGGEQLADAQFRAAIDVVAAFGRSSQGIEFDALDNAPVKFVVLFIVPKNQFQTHLRTLASIAKFLNDRSVREQLARNLPITLRYRARKLNHFRRIDHRQRFAAFGSDVVSGDDSDTSVLASTG